MMTEHCFQHLDVSSAVMRCDAPLCFGSLGRDKRARRVGRGARHGFVYTVRHARVGSGKRYRKGVSRGIASEAKKFERDSRSRNETKLSSSLVCRVRPVAGGAPERAFDVCAFTYFVGHTTVLRILARGLHCTKVFPNDVSWHALPLLDCR